MSKILRILLIWLCGLSLTVFAGTTGKIVGTVTDEESNEPLPMVNVLIEGSNLGAATDIKGHFVILNVPPGTYNLVGSMMGYGKKRIQNVRVTIDQTTLQNFTLKTVSLVGEEVTVVAERPVVQKDISNSQMNLGAQEIEILPLTTIKEVLTLQAGIERGSEGILVRGGGANQTQVSIDGMITNDERSNIGYLALSQSAVQEIQIQTGGFNAEYGNLRSGLVNVVTKEGQRATYNLSANLNYRPPANKYFGESIYSANSYFNRPYLDPAVCWTGTANGVWDEYTRRQYPHFEGWDAISEATVRDKDPKNDLTPAGAKRLYEWQHRRQGDIDKPDYVVDLGFGGPFPLISKMLGEARFFLTYFRNQNMFIFPLARDNYGENFTQLKLTSNISPSMSLTLTGLYGEVHSVSPYDWTTTPTGRVLELQGEIADLVNSTNGSSILYMPGYYSPSAVYRNFVALKFVHQLNPNTFYEISLQHKMSFYNTYQMSLRDTSRQYEVVPGYFVDEAPYGYWGYGSTGIEGMSMGGWMNLGRDQSENSTTSFRFDLVNQINRANQLKGGAEVVYNDFNIRSGTECPSMTTWTRDMYYRVFPYRLGAYLQDKLEVRGFIANLGVRFDYSDPNTNNYVLQEYDKYFRAGFGKTLEQSVTTEAAEPSWNLCPRLGISHPITDNSKLYFNYGHFLTEPQSTYRFRLQRESNGLVTYLGNRSLEMEKTVAYELGFSQNVLDMLLLNVAAYYKDVTNQPGWIYYQNINSAVQYYKSTNNNYADIRGFEITLKKQMGRWLSGFVNYTYDVVTSGYFGYTKYFEDPNKQRDYLRLNPVQSRPHPQPYARVNLDLHTPDQYGPRWLGFYPLEKWNLNFLADWEAGSYYTYNPNRIPGVVDDTQWKDWYNLDLRLSKAVRIYKLNFQFFLDMTNVLNTKYMNYAGFADQYDFLDYLESLNFSWETGAEKGSDRIGDYRKDDVAYDPLELNPNNDPEIKARNDRRKENKAYIDMPNIKSFTFLNPRDIVFGVKINF